MPPTNIRSIATLATSPAYSELVLMLRSLALFHPDLPVLILSDSVVEKKLQEETGLPTDFRIFKGFQQYRNIPQNKLSDSQWINIQNQKARIIEQALKYHSNTLLTDCDVVFTAPLGLVDESKDLGLILRAPYRIDEFGKYSGGFLWVRNKQFTSWWKNQMSKNSSKLADQLVLNTAPQHFQTFLFPISYNFTFNRRIFEKGRKHQVAEISQEKSYPLLQLNSIPQKGIAFGDKSIVSIHGHIHLDNIFKPITYLCMMTYLYNGAPEVFNLINQSPHIKYSVSGEQLMKRRMDLFSLQLMLTAASAVMKKRRLLFFSNYYSGILKYLIRLLLAPYGFFYLIREAHYVYHLSHRLGGEKLAYSRILIALFKVAFIAFTSRDFFEKRLLDKFSLPADKIIAPPKLL